MFKCVYLLALFLVVILQKFIASYFCCFIHIYISRQTQVTVIWITFSPSCTWPPVDFGPGTKLGKEDSPFCSNFSMQTVVWIVPNYVRPRKFTQYSNNSDVQTRGKLSDQCTRLGSCVLARTMPAPWDAHPLPMINGGVERALMCTSTLCWSLVAVRRRRTMENRYPHLLSLPPLAEGEIFLLQQMSKHEQ